MHNQKLIERVRAEISGHRCALVDLSKRSKTEDGRIYTNADMRDSRTGVTSPLQLNFILRFNHILSATSVDAATYCSRCLDRVEGIFEGVMGGLLQVTLQSELLEDLPS